MTVRLRPLTDDERLTLERLTRSRTAPARDVERAAIVWRASQGQRVPAIATALNISAKTVRKWLTRFNADGLPGLMDAPRPGRPVTYTRDVVNEVLATALTHPPTLGLPFTSWTLDRLERYLNDAKQLPIKRSRIDELLLAQGVRWQPHETPLGEPDAREFAHKQGAMSPAAPRRSRRAS